MKLNGFDDLQKRLSSIQKNAESLAGKRNVSFDVLFPNSFMAAHTKSPNIQSFLADLKVTDQQSFNDLPQKDLEQKVISETDFESWQDMMNTAGKKYYENHLFS